MNSRYQRGAELLRSGRFDLAEGELRAAIDHSPTDALAHATLAGCLTELNRVPEAVNAAKRAVQLDPNLSHANAAMALALLRSGEAKEAQQWAERAIAQDPRDPRNFVILGGIFFTRRAYREAIATAERGLAIAPADENCQNLLGHSLALIGQTRAARQTLRQVLSQNPIGDLPHYTMGWAEIIAGNYRQAE